APRLPRGLMWVRRVREGVAGQAGRRTRARRVAALPASPWVAIERRHAASSRAWITRIRPLASAELWPVHDGLGRPAGRPEAEIELGSQPRKARRIPLDLRRGDGDRLVAGRDRWVRPSQPLRETGCKVFGHLEADELVRPPQLRERVGHAALVLEDQDARAVEVPEQALELRSVKAATERVGGDHRPNVLAIAGAPDLAPQPAHLVTDAGEVAGHRIPEQHEQPRLGSSSCEQGRGPEVVHVAWGPLPAQRTVGPAEEIVVRLHILVVEALAEEWVEVVQLLRWSRPYQGVMTEQPPPPRSPAALSAHANEVGWARSPSSRSPSCPRPPNRPTCPGESSAHGWNPGHAGGRVRAGHGPEDVIHRGGPGPAGASGSACRRSRGRELPPARAHSSQRPQSSRRSTRPRRARGPRTQRERPHTPQRRPLSATQWRRPAGSRDRGIRAPRTRARPRRGRKRHRWRWRLQRSQASGSGPGRERPPRPRSQSRWECADAPRPRS